MDYWFAYNKIIKCSQYENKSHYRREKIKASKFFKNKEDFEKSLLFHILFCMKYWLIKSEPSEYSIDRLQKEGKTLWSWVRNYQARNFMRDEMRVWDRVFFYHSSCANVGIVGEGIVASEAYADPTQFDTKSDYFDPKATPEKPIWYCVDIGFGEKFGHIISLADIRGNPELSSMRILQKGNRLSITPVSEEEYATTLSYTFD